MIKLRPARASEAAILSDLCMRSKAVWGYDEKFMAMCRDELTISADALDPQLFQVAEYDGDIAGLVQVELNGQVCVIDKLFIDPDHQAAGIGRALFGWAADAARDHGADWITIDADPGAAGFYQRMGAREDGVSPSGSIPGRRLPKFRFDL